MATGADLNTATCTDFVGRLRHDCNGAGVKWHHTACALFTVQAKRIDYGFEPDYAEGLVVCLEDQSWFVDQAQDRISELRDELGEAKGEYDRAVNKLDALQLRLNAADQRIDELTQPKAETVWCACGDGHAANSYGAGFLAANNGVCENCEAAGGGFQEPVLIQAVAVTREGDDGMYLEWLLEGGICELELPGTMLFALPEANDLCDEDGSAEIYTSPPAPVSVVLPERLQQVLKFLEGAENLDGYWFGEPGPHGSKVWWRAELRKALEETNLFAKPL